MRPITGNARKGSSIRGHARTAGPDTGTDQKASQPNTLGDSWFREEEVKLFRRELLQWYDCNHRILPWRRTPFSQKTDAVLSTGPSSPEERVEPAPAELPPQQFAYWVWVSEIMLQQTQVATVIPYFKRWVAKWPTVVDLAGADINTVNALWAGLGYYRRARYLLDGALYVTEKLDGKFPTTTSELLKIPGVGPYTSAAVASIAFGTAAAAVDGNVIRVVSRLRALPGDPTKLAAVHTAMAAELLHRDRPGCYNQALMELGATVCRPLNPDCEACPVRSVCRADAEWKAYLEDGGAPDIEDAPHVTQYPGRKAVKEKREQVVAVTVLEVICTSQPAGVKAVEQTVGTTAEAQALVPRVPRKRQRTMQDFALAAAARKQQQQQQPVGAAAEVMTPAMTGYDEDTVASLVADREARPGADGAAAANGGCLAGVDLEALVARGVRHYLIAMRPQGGLLAGLWEFPGVVVKTDAPMGDCEKDETDEVDDRCTPSRPTPSTTTCPTTERQRACDALIRRLLGTKIAVEGTTAAASKGVAPVSEASDPASRGDAAGEDGGATSTSPPSHALRVLARHDMGLYVHVFSHIRQTNHIQRVTAVFHGDLAMLVKLTGACLAASPPVDTAVIEAVGADTKADSDEEDVVVVAVESGLEGLVAKAKTEKCVGSSSAPSVAVKRAQSRVTAEVGSRGKQRRAAGADVDEDAAVPSVMWASRQQIEGAGLGLSSGVRKIFQQAVGASEGLEGGMRVGKGTAGKRKSGSVKGAEAKTK